ncbi:MAG TPA: glycosyl hydrolase family 18 protein [Streptosporangiaceae bacterium]|nr:glycosyl hydrolase family 18 protein [Streptosporangiaceae bacterium]
MAGRAGGAGPGLAAGDRAGGLAGGAPASGRPAGRPDRRRLRWYVGAAWLSVAVAGAVLAGLSLYPRSAPAAPRRVVVASLPYWNIGHGTTTVLAHRRNFTEVSPWVYGLAGNGQIDTQYPPGQTANTQAQIARLRATGLRVVPSLANITAGRWSYQPVAAILHDPVRRRQQVAAIVALVSQHHYAGVDIDYEDLHVGDRGAFTAFITELASALHARHKILSVALFAKTSDAGYAPRNVAQNYAAIGRVADQVRIMAYGYHWGTSPPGPVAPIGWVRAVLRYAKSQIPASKIVLGVGLYGYDWSGGHGRAVSWLAAFRLSTRYHARLRYDTASQAPWFSYTDAAGHQHVVWFENRASAQAKFAAAMGAQVGGVFLWMFGYEDAGTWTALRHTLPVPRPSTPARAPGRAGPGQAAPAAAGGTP